MATDARRDPNALPTSTAFGGPRQQRAHIHRVTMRSCCHAACAARAADSAPACLHRALLAKARRLGRWQRW
eukprot:1336929-Pleurochrysis_carterae.AAC.5